MKMNKKQLIKNLMCIMYLRDLKGFPKKKEIPFGNAIGELKVIGYNQALSEIGEIELVMDVEAIRKVIIREELVPTVCEDSGLPEWTVGESKELAQVIADNIKDITKVKK